LTDRNLHHATLAKLYNDQKEDYSAILKEYNTSLLSSSSSSSSLTNFRKQA